MSNSNLYNRKYFLKLQIKLAKQKQIENQYLNYEEENFDEYVFRLEDIEPVYDDTYYWMEQEFNNQSVIDDAEQELSDNSIAVSSNVSATIPTVSNDTLTTIKKQTIKLTTHNRFIISK